MEMFNRLISLILAQFPDQFSNVNGLPFFVNGQVTICQCQDARMWILISNRRQSDNFRDVWNLISWRLLTEGGSRERLLQIAKTPGK